MKKIFILLFATTIISNFSYAQKKVGGITMPEKIELKENTLVLNGAGVREKMWIDLYACGLYIKTKTTDAKSIINSKELSGIKIHIVSSLITSEKMNNAVEDGFKKSAGDNIKSLRKDVDTFKSIFAKEDIKKGDIYDIMYIPNKGVVVFKNGKIFPAINNFDFKKALFAIWLGDDPADDDLKEELLGK